MRRHAPILSQDEAMASTKPIVQISCILSGPMFFPYFSMYSNKSHRAVKICTHTHNVRYTMECWISRYGLKCEKYIKWHIWGVPRQMSKKCPRVPIRCQKHVRGHVFDFFLTSSRHLETFFLTFFWAHLQAGHLTVLLHFKLYREIQHSICIEQYGPTRSPCSLINSHVYSNSHVA